MILRKWMVALVLTGVVAISGVGQAFAEAKIGVFDMREVMGKCEAGQALQEKMKARVQALQTEFQAEQKGVSDLEDEIAKKSSAWSSEKISQKKAELANKRRDLQRKTEDANIELKQLEQTELKPIVEAFNKMIGSYGEKKGYTAILARSSGVVYFDKSIEITDALVKELNAAMAKK